MKHAPSSPTILLILSLCLSGLQPAALAAEYSAPAHPAVEANPEGGRAAGDWPQFHYGGGRTGFNPDESELGLANIDELTLKWAVSTGGIVKSSPVVADGVVYVGSGSDYIYALDADTGAIRWKRNLGADVRSSPAVVGGRVYVGSWNKKLYALDADTGAVDWTFDMPGPVTAPPLVSGGVVYEGSRGSGGTGTFFALDADTGRVKWSVNTWSIWEGAAIADGVVYVGSDKSTLWALDADNGNIKWTAQTGAYIRCTPSVSGGVVYVGSDDHRLYAFNAANGALKWKTGILPNGSLVRSSPALAYDKVYIDTAEVTPMGSTVYAYDQDDGSPVWTHGMSDYSTSSPAVANGVVYVGDGGGQFDAFDANTGEMVYASGWTLTKRIYGGPAVSNGVVYFASVNSLVYAMADLAGPPVGDFVAIRDSGFDPVDLVWHDYGKSVMWTNFGTQSHTVSSVSVIEPFDSGTLQPGGTFTHYYHAAGQYEYEDRLHSVPNAWVKVWPTAAPATGSLSTQFTIRWADGPAPSGYVYDVQIDRPGPLGPEPWRTGTTSASATFTPDDGRGEYKFQARMRPTDTTTGLYSPFVSIDVN